MKIGDKVKHQSGNFSFVGTVLGTVTSKRGENLCVVEQKDTDYVQLFGEHSLTVFETKLTVESDFFDSIPIPPPPPPIPAFPVLIFVPVKPLPHQAAKAQRFKTEVRQNYLLPKPFVSLITGSVKAELEFHFEGECTGDLDNLVKPVLDLLKGSVIYDDKQVKEISAKFVCPSSKTGFGIRLTSHETQG